MAYLKDIVPLIPGGIVTARIMSIGPVQTNRNNKQLRMVQFLFPSTGQTHEESVFEFNFGDSLAGVKIGDTVEITIKKGWPVFKIISGDAESAPPASQSSFKQVQGERAATKVLVASDDARELKDTQICLQGLMQAWIAGGVINDDVTLEARADLALKFAVIAREKLLARSKELVHGISLPVQTTKIEDTPWGDDEVAPFPTE
jgi:hypothetical protein